MAMKIEAIKSVADLKQFLNEQGSCYFSEESTRFFNSTIESKVYHGKQLLTGPFVYIVTGEKFNETAPREYTIVRFDENGDNYRESEAGEYDDVDEAIHVLESLLE